MPSRAIAGIVCVVMLLTGSAAADRPVDPPPPTTTPTPPTTPPAKPTPPTTPTTSPAKPTAPTAPAKPTTPPAKPTAPTATTPTPPAKPTTPPTTPTPPAKPTTPPTAPATPAPSTPPPATIAPHASPFDAYSGANERGRELFDAARKLTRDGDTAAACAKFAEAWKLEEVASTQLNLARCRENEGKYAEAWRMFEDVARRARDGGLPERARVASEAASSLDEKLATVVIKLGAPIAPGTVVTVNGRVLLDATTAEIRERVDPGNVVVTAKGPTGVTSTRAFRIFAKNTFTVDVPPLHERTAGRRPLWIAGSVVLAGGGVIALGAGSGGVRFVGGAAIIGGVTMFLLAPKQRVTVVPMIISNETGAGVAFAGRF